MMNGYGPMFATPPVYTPDTQMRHSGNTGMTQREWVIAQMAVALFSDLLRRDEIMSANMTNNLVPENLKDEIKAAFKVAETIISVMP